MEFQRGEIMEENRIKRCLFCNGKATLHTTMGFHNELISGYIKCENCGSSSATFSTIEGAIEAWNARYSDRTTNKENIGKWIAFRQEGMPMVLHGKIIHIYETCYAIKCKNGQKRFAESEDIIGFYDSKQECYSVRN